MSKSNIFAGRLKELRERAGLTQAALAERAGIHTLTVAKLEQGIREPTFETALALSDALGTTCEELRKPPSTPQPERGRGRPPNADKPAPGPKRPRGRPRKEK